MRLFVFLFVIGISVRLFGQVTPKNTPAADFRKVQIGVNFSPDYCYRTQNGGDYILMSEMLVGSSNNYETGKLGYTTGLNLIYNFNKNIGIEAGIQYSNKGYQIKIKWEDFDYPDNIDSRHGFVFNSSTIKSLKFINNFHYIDIPLKVNFIFGKKKIRFITSAGIVTNIFIKVTNTTVYIYDDRKRHRSSEISMSYHFSDVNLSPIVSVGIDWKFDSRNSLRIEPTFRYGVLKIINTPLTAYLWNAGLNISYYFGMK